jgi:hypothetical protein
VRDSIAQIERPCELRGVPGVFAVGTPYATDLDVTHRHERLKVKPRDESAPYNTNSQHSFAHKSSIEDSDAHVQVGLFNVFYDPLVSLGLPVLSRSSSE